MIGKVRKYLFFGLKQEIDHFFDEAQKIGIIEFIRKDSRKKERLPSSVKDIY